mgnify:CR=1 FL=1|tara:strand:- start:1835 stop:2092 length:258 start_codon:yes stop_codon:yes gene_type:complete
MTDKEQLRKIREDCLEQLDMQYASRMEELVDEMRLEDAESILKEMVTTDDESDEETVFMDDLTDWSKEELSNIEFENLGEFENLE